MNKLLEKSIKEKIVMKEEKIKFAKVEYKGCNLVKVTDLPFDDIIGHTDNKQEYFTLENNNIIYKRLREELNMQYSLPRLGVSVDFGLGDICLEECTLEDKKIFKFYTVVFISDNHHYRNTGSCRWRTET